MALVQQKVDEKSNEITAIPKILDSLVLKGCIITIDAMGCQKKIVEKIRIQEADYVIAVKGNQKMLHEDISFFFDDAQEHGFKDIEHSYCKTVDKGHGRFEVRRYWLSPAKEISERNPSWRDLNGIGMVESERHENDKVSVEKRYYIASITSDVERFAQAVRNHWGIENSQHWVLDIAFREDEQRMRIGNAAENAAILRRIALNLLKQEKTCKRGIETKRKKAGWDNDYLLKILKCSKHV